MRNPRDEDRYGWSRMLRRSKAAAYLDMSEAAFQKEVDRGTIPEPVELDGGKRWCRHAIDKAIDRLTGADAVPGYLKEFNARYPPKP